jgi:DNA-binding CsgD family transcriptional regulator
VGRSGDWSKLFSAAFQQSRNAMMLLDSSRCFVDVNGALLKLTGYKRDHLVGRPLYDIVVGGPLNSREEWEAMMASGRFTGEAELLCADSHGVAVQWGANVEVVTGHRLILVVTLSVSRWGRRFRRAVEAEQEIAALSEREFSVVRLVALGDSGPEIAETLGITHETVRTHVRNAMVKTATRSRAQLVAKVLGEGIILR